VQRYYFFCKWPNFFGNYSHGILPQTACKRLTDAPWTGRSFTICHKTTCILRQNATHFAANCLVFCGKTPLILPQNAAVIWRKTGGHFAAKRRKKGLHFGVGKTLF
jgi:hypothetical protein